MMTDLATSISRIRLRASGDWREAAVSNDLGDAGAVPGATDEFGPVSHQAPTEVSAPPREDSFEAPSPRTPELTPVISRLMAFCESVDYRIIGISSDSRRSGVSLITRELARGYAELGRPVCLIDASSFKTTAPAGSLAGAASLDLRSLSQRHRDGYHKIDLLDLQPTAKYGTAEFRESLGPWIGETGVVLVDLPPVCEPDGTTRTSAITIGAACDLVLLVCRTGAVQKSDFCRSLMVCRSGRMKIGGIVLNDFELALSHLIPCDC